MRAALLVSAYTLAAVVGPAEPAGIRELLQAYRSRQFALLTKELDRQLSTYDGARRFVNALRGARKDVDPLVYAGFALEAAEVAGRRYMGAARDLGELGCERLRSSAVAADTQVIWNVGLLAAMSGPFSDRLTGRLQVHSIVMQEDWNEHFDHLPEAVRQDHRLVFALGVSRQAAIHTFDITWGRSRPELRPAARLVDEANAAFLQARRHPELADEAELRLAWLDLRFGRKTDPVSRLSSLAKVARSSRVRYLALLLTGRALLELQRWTEAEAVFLAALNEQPRTGEAAWRGAQVARFLDPRPVSPAVPARPGESMADPWRHFFETFAGLERPRHFGVLALRERLP